MKLLEICEAMGIPAKESAPHTNNRAVECWFLGNQIIFTSAELNTETIEQALFYVATALMPASMEDSGRRRRLLQLFLIRELDDSEPILKRQEEVYADSPYDLDDAYDVYEWLRKHNYLHFDKNNLQHVLVWGHGPHESWK